MVDGYLCRSCSDQLAQVFKELPDLLAALEVTVVGMDRLDGTTDRSAVELEDHAAVESYAKLSPWLRSTHGRMTLPTTSMGYSPGAAQVMSDARALLTSTVEVLFNAQGIFLPRPPVGPACELWRPRGKGDIGRDALRSCGHDSCTHIRAYRQETTNARICTWLGRQLGPIGMDPSAGILARDFDRLRKRIERIVDTNQPDVFLGRCDAQDVRVHITPDGSLTPRPGECGADLYAREGDAEIACTVCGYQYAVADRKEAMLAIVYDQIRPIADVANAITGLLTKPIDRPGDAPEPVECTQSMIRGFELRGRLTYRGVDPAGRNLVRVGDVVDLLRARMERDHARRTRKVSA